MQNKKLGGRLTRWGKARQDAKNASITNDVDALVDALLNLDRKTELVIKSLSDSETYKTVKALTEETKQECMSMFAVNYAEDLES